MFFWYSKGWHPSTKIPDLQEKVAIVTGANTGIGYATAEELVRHGAKVYLGARSEKKALAAIEQLQADVPSAKKENIVWLPLDLADLDNVVKAAQTVLNQETRLDILINNAGLAAQTYETTSEGYELSMGVNHLGHFLFTINLLPILKSTASRPDSDVRVVIVTSNLHANLIPDNLRFDKIGDFQYPGITPFSNYSGSRDQISRYGVSKLANILISKELQRRLDADGWPIIVTSVNPGMIYSQCSMSFVPSWMRIFSGAWMGTPAQGAVPVLYLATDPAIKQDAAKSKALYYTCALKPAMPSALAQDQQVARNLWELSMRAISDFIEG